MATFTSKGTTALLLVLLAAIAEASIYQTTIVTTETIDSSKTQYRKCRKEMEKYPLYECLQKYMQQCGHREILLTSVRSSECDVPQECCQQLKKMDDECMCPSLMMTAKQMKEGPEEMMIMQKMAKRVLSKCDQPTDSCEFQEQEY